MRGLQHALLMAMVLAIPPARAADVDFPVKPLRVICPFAAGGSRDIVGRVFAGVSDRYLGKPVIVVNKPGASGVVGLQTALQATPDGYTLALVSTSDINVIEATIASGQKLPFDPRDLVLLGAYTRSPVQVIVSQESPWRSLEDMVRALKAQPGHFNYCSGGRYNVTHVATELLLRATGTSAWMVPYKGAGPCIPAVVGGEIHFSVQFLSSTIPLVRSQRLRALAVLGAERILPDVPTTRELGIDVQVYQMLGLAAPRGTPPAVIAKLSATIRQVAADPAFARGVEATGDSVRYSSAEEFTRYWQSDSARLAVLLKSLVREAR